MVRRSQGLEVAAEYQPSRRPERLGHVIKHRRDEHGHGSNCDVAVCRILAVGLPMTGNFNERVNGVFLRFSELIVYGRPRFQHDFSHIYRIHRVGIVGNRNLQRALGDGLGHEQILGIGSGRNIEGVGAGFDAIHLETSVSISLEEIMPHAVDLRPPFR